MALEALYLAKRIDKVSGEGRNRLWLDMARPARSSRYSAYTGGADPLAPPVDLREALEQIGQDVMEGTSPRRALSELLRRGTRTCPVPTSWPPRRIVGAGRLLQRNNLDGTLQEIKKLLDEAVLAERKELARGWTTTPGSARCSSTRCRRHRPRPCRNLSDYDWRSPEAREKYDQIKDLLGREMLDQRFAGMKQALENATDEDRQRVNEMLDDLNDLLDKHLRGEDTQLDFDDFMAKHGEFFPENPRNVEELLDSLAQRAAAAQRFRNSLSADQRAELDALAQQAFGSPSLMNALNRLDAHLQAARPGEDWTGSSRFSGDNPMGMGEGAQALADIAELEQLAEALSQSYAGATMDDVDLRCWPASSATRRPSTRARLPSWKGVDRAGLPGPRLRRSVAAVAEGHAPAGADGVTRCGATVVGPPR